MTRKKRIAATVIGAVVLGAIVLIGARRQDNTLFRLGNYSGGAIDNVVVSYPGGSFRIRSLANRASHRIYVPQSAEFALRIRYQGPDGVNHEHVLDHMHNVIHSSSELVPVSWDNILGAVERAASRGPQKFYRVDAWIDKNHVFWGESRAEGDTDETDDKRSSYRLDFLLRYLAQTVFP